MKLLGDGIARTYWTDEHDAEWYIRILFSYQPAERPDYEDGHMTYPGCDAGIVDMQVERLDLTGWELFDEVTQKEMDDWSVEIMEAINQQVDDRGNEP